MEKMSFADELRKEQERLNLSQAELAKVLDVSPRAVWQWLKGDEPMKLTQEGALARLRKTGPVCKKCGVQMAETAKDATCAFCAHDFGANAKGAGTDASEETP